MENSNKNKWDAAQEDMAFWSEWYENSKHALPQGKSEAPAGPPVGLEEYNLAMDGPRVFVEDSIPNPVYSDTIGKDQDDPEPVWVSEDLLTQIETLKNKLFKLENEMNAKDAGGNKFVEKCHHPQTKELFEKMQSLRKEIDRVSNTLGIKDEPSPFVAKG